MFKVYEVNIVLQECRLHGRVNRKEDNRILKLLQRMR